MPFGNVARGQTSGAGIQSPLSMLNDFAQLQGRMLDNQNRARDLQAYDSLGQTIATSPPDQLYDNLRRNPGLARHPDVITNIANAGLATTHIAQAQQEMTDDASKAWGTSLAQIYNSPNPSQEQWDALVQARADTMADPVARNNFITHSYDIGRSIFAGATSPDQVKQRILGQVTSSVGGWDAIQGGILGGPMTTIGDRPFFRPLGGPPGTILPVTPTGTVGASPLQPLGSAFGASPAAMAPQPNALAPAAPADTGPSYAPGQVTVAPLQPPGATTAPTPAAAPGAPAPAPGGAPQMAADGTMPPGSLAGKALDKPLAPSPITGATGFDPAVQEAVTHRLEQFRDGDHGDLSKFNAAQQITANTAYIRDAFNQLKQDPSGWMTSGPGATARADALRRINVIRGMLHMDPLSPAAEGSFTELQKQQVQLGFTSLSQFFGHGREAAQTIETSLAAVPGGENSFFGGQLVNRTIEAMAEREMRRYKFMDQFQSENHGSLAGADEAFNAIDPAAGTANKVLGEFGLGPRGFEGATPQETDQNLQNAVRKGIITAQEGVNLRNHRPADWKQTETRLPGGGVSAPIPPYTQPRMP